MILSETLPPVVSLEALESWRDKMATRVALLALEHDPLVVETFEYETKAHADLMRGKLTTLLLTRINTVNARIRELTAWRAA